jgi:hypothetical protein
MVGRVLRAGAGAGRVITLPIGGADMPVVISLFNAFTGLAVGFEGLCWAMPAMIIAGIVVGAAGTPADPADGQGHEPLRSATCSSAAHDRCGQAAEVGESGGDDEGNRRPWMRHR